MTRRILLVDDNADIRALATISLEQVGGHEVRTAASGHEALGVLEHWTPDVVVLDVRMPGMDGPETLATIRATSEVPVVFLTASVVDSEIGTLSRLPVSGVLTKPFDPIALPEQLNGMLGW